MRQTALQALALLLLIALAGACRQPSAIRPSGSSSVAVDFSGSWELDHQLSDRVQDNANFLRLEAIAEARRAQGRLDRRVPRLPAFELVELADDISRTPVLTIKQGPDRIEVDRGDEFPLTCTFGPDGPYVADDPLGTEICGWDLHQLLFAFRLPDRLSVIHRLTLGPEGDKLNVATTVRGRGADQRFTLNRVYTRFEPLADEYDCRLNPSGTKTCRLLGPEETASEPP